MKQAILLVVLGLAVAGLSGAEGYPSYWFENPPNDKDLDFTGVEWRQWNPTLKLVYVKGYYDGMFDVGVRFSIDLARTEAYGSSMLYTYDAIVTFLDHFYKDDRQLHVRLTYITPLIATIYTGVTSWAKAQRER